MGGVFVFGTEEQYKMVLHLAEGETTLNSRINCNTLV